MKEESSILCNSKGFEIHQREKAEREGFEPPEPYGSTVFKTAAFDRSVYWNAKVDIIFKQANF